MLFDAVNMPGLLHKVTVLVFSVLHVPCASRAVLVPASRDPQARASEAPIYTVRVAAGNILDAGSTPVFWAAPVRCITISYVESFVLGSNFGGLP